MFALSWGHLDEDLPAQIFRHLAIISVDQIAHTAFACILSHHIQEPLLNTC